MTLSTVSTASGGPGPPQSFAALRHPGYRAYLFGNALAMMADSIEHVITYWTAFQKFHSPALGGFAVISHYRQRTGTGDRFAALQLETGQGVGTRLDPMGPSRSDGEVLDPGQAVGTPAGIGLAAAV